MKRVALVGNYVPRQCGIATFTTDLCNALATSSESITCFAVATTDIEAGYDYPPRVQCELEETNIDSYRYAAQFLNRSEVDVVSLQHEYGIYGGPAGSHILTLLKELHVPVVTTLHTVLREPDWAQRTVLKEVVGFSERVVVMSRAARDILETVYRVPSEKIDLIPHGIPDMPFADSDLCKSKLGFAGQAILLTYGLLSIDKGLEYVIESLPTILSSQPNVVYIVLGVTHPRIKQQHGEAYRMFLEQLARERGVDGKVIFYDRFVPLDELPQFIGAADICITPYLKSEQITSGTLTYSLGAGRAIISTCFNYAEEVLAEGRGILVPFRDPQAIAEKVIYLLTNDTECRAMQQRAYRFARAYIWPRVAQSYLASFEKAEEGNSRRMRSVSVFKCMTRETGTLPPLNLDHLRRMTDDTGIFQHAVFSLPNYTAGYTTDDNARALAVAVLLEELGGDTAKVGLDLAPHYTAFLWYAFNRDLGRFRNFLGYDRRWLEDIGSEDSHSRALWSLSLVLGRSKRRELRNVADRLFQAALPAAASFKYPRPWAYTLVGLHEYQRRYLSDPQVRSIIEILAEQLMDLYQSTRGSGWLWFESSLTYCNAVLPHGLLVGGKWLSRTDMVDAGLEALHWLTAIQTSEDNHFIPIGCSGFYSRGGDRARFDQQPIEAYTTVSACLEAFRLTGDLNWWAESQRAFNWFLGWNDLNLPLHDLNTGGCHDGLRSDWLNEDQGAESTLAFLLSLLEMMLTEQETNSGQPMNSSA